LKNKKYLIYKRTCTVTGLSYVGLTSSTNEEERWKQHVYSARSYGFKYKLDEAIRLYGDKCWNVSILEKNLNRKKAFEKEKFYIKKENTYYNGYNSNKGGWGGINTKALIAVKANSSFLIERPIEFYSTTECSIKLKINCALAISKKAKYRKSLGGYYVFKRKDFEENSLINLINERVKESKKGKFKIKKVFRYIVKFKDNNKIFKIVTNTEAVRITKYSRQGIRDLVGKRNNKNYKKIFINGREVYLEYKKICLL
jgi:hypothetical protein